MLLHYNIVRKNIIIGMSAIGINALLAFYNETSEVVARHFELYLITKWFVIIACLISIIMAIKRKHLELTQELVPIVAIFFMCSGELFAPGYNLAYTQLVIFIPMMMKVPFWRIATYLGVCLFSYLISIAFGQTLNTTVQNYPNYITDVVISIFTSTFIGFFLAFFVKRYEDQLEELRGRYANFGLNSSMVIHDLKNNLMTPYRQLSSIKDSPGALMATSAIEESINKLHHVLNFHTDTQYCDPRKAIEEVTDAMNLASYGIIVDHRGVTGHLPISVNNFKSIILNAFGNSAHMTDESGASLVLTIEYIDHGLRIIDNGPGFPVDVIKNFENLVASSVKSLGNGIGLINSRMIVEMSGGSMSLSNHPSGGAVITISFI